MAKAIFLDRDGVINEPCYHDELGIYSPRTTEELRIYPHVKESCQKLKELGYQLIVVSNQPGVAFGTIKEENLNKISDQIKSEIPEIEAFYYCTHHPMHTEDCDCRKPKDGLLKQAEKDHQIDISSSILVGDNLSDIEAGKDCTHTILLADTRIDLLSFIETKKIIPNYIAKDLSHATLIIQDINNKNYENHTADCDSCWRLGDKDVANL